MPNFLGFYDDTVIVPIVSKSVSNFLWYSFSNSLIINV